MITTVLCYSATSGIAVADYGKPCRVDMGNVGLAPFTAGSNEVFLFSRRGIWDVAPMSWASSLTDQPRVAWLAPSWLNSTTNGPLAADTSHPPF